jgi:hypothetical protein
MAHQISGRSAATAATAEHAAACLWNPHATKGIFCKYVELAITVGTACSIALRRASARGTAGSSITSAREHDSLYGAAAQSGAILDLAAYTVQPTLIGTSSTTSSLRRWNFGAVIGSGVMWFFKEPGVFIPAGAGLVLVTPIATIFQPADINFGWDDE